LRALLASLLLLLAALAPVGAAERIERFSSGIVIGTDGSLEVTETIAATAEGGAIRRGIYRDFPTRYRDARGRTVVVGFSVLAVTRDGRPERWRVEDRGAGVRVWIGDPDVLLEPGRHVWKLTYRTDGQLGFFEAHDELYWNVTGNDWAFAIGEAEVTVHLPAGAPVRDWSAYTGPRGARGTDFELLEAAPGIFRARTTRELAPGEGFTIAVAFPKGIVNPPAVPREMIGASVPLAALGLVLAWWLVAWWRVGRDPPPGTVVPLFDPPPGMGPAAARYVWRSGFDHRVPVAAILSLAVKGRLRIVEQGDGFLLEQRPAGPGSPEPTGAERALETALFANGRPSVVIARNGGEPLREARSALQRALRAEYEGAVIRRNRGWFAVGVLLSLLAVAAVVVLVRPAPEAFSASLFTGFWLGMLLLRVRDLAARWREASGALARIGRLLRGGVALLLFALVPAGLLVLLFLDPDGGLPPTLWTPAELATFATVPLMVVLAALFWRLLHAPTTAGRRLLDELAGFRRYLSVAEEHRLGILHPPELTPERFERYLPWAWALDCEHAWSERFAKALAGAEPPAPDWYVGRSRADPLALSRSLSSSFASAVAAASAPPPGSRSGIGGGGSSGGGGGGGGGGGW
jgi:hypothetical protein